MAGVPHGDSHFICGHDLGDDPHQADGCEGARKFLQDHSADWILAKSFRTSGSIGTAFDQAGKPSRSDLAFVRCPFPDGAIPDTGLYRYS